LGRVLLSPERLSEVVRRLGRRITEDYRGKDLALVCILRGAVVFLADLLREIKIPCTIDFVAISSYGSSTKSSGVVRIQKDLSDSVEGKHVLVVEDIVDTGRTLDYIKRNLLTRGPASLKICTLLAKQVKRHVEVELEYVGAVVPDEFVVGYGLDHAQKLRNLPAVYSLPDETDSEE
jgi:hypoxanthine phosphoribosyltransferase